MHFGIRQIKQQTEPKLELETAGEQTERERECAPVVAAAAPHRTTRSRETLACDNDRATCWQACWSIWRSLSTSSSCSVGKQSMIPNLLWSEYTAVPPSSRWATTQSCGPSPLPTAAPWEKAPGLPSRPPPRSVHRPLIPRWQSHVTSPSILISRYFALLSIPSTFRPEIVSENPSGKGNLRSALLRWSSVTLRPTRCLIRP